MRRLDRRDCAILPLVLKGRWYDMIASGEKREEYRLQTPYWATRLSNWDNADAAHHVVEFRLGYAADAPRMAYISPTYVATCACRHPAWGEPSQPHYAIVLGERVELADGPEPLPHSPTPWRLAWHERYGDAVIDAAYDPVATMHGDAASANAELLVAAVNERDRLRDLVGRLAQRLQMARLMGFGLPARDELLDEAREALGEAAP